MKVKNGDKAALKWVYAKSKKQHIRLMTLRLFCNSLNERIRAELENDMSTTDSSTVVIENENNDGGLVDDAGEDYQDTVTKTESSQSKRLRANYLQ